MSASKVNEVDLIVWWFIRNYYENKKRGRNVPLALKYLIKNFSKNAFSSKILSIKQDYDLIQLLQTKLTNTFS